jgi:LysR family transcriptional regulator, glycine cleavage system transcriptional activator
LNSLPLTAVRAFCAAAEHLSFKTAAQAMHVTPGAISQQVKQLENWFGLKLFERRVRGVALTDAGNAFFASAQKSLRQLDSAAKALRPEEKTVRITTVPSLAARWLVPRLAAFGKQHPSIEISVDASTEVIDLENGAFDLAIRSATNKGKNPSPNLHAVLLFDQLWWPVCSASYKKSHVRSQQIQPSARLLHETGGPRTVGKWDEWLSENATLSNVNAAKGAYFSHEMLAYQAAIQSQGIALANRPLIEQELSQGSLVIAVNKPLSLERSYYVMWPKLGVRQNDPKGSVQIFRQWLVDSISH